MPGFDSLLKSFNVRDLLDEIASADPPAYLRRCFAEGVSAPSLSFARIQQLAVCAMVVDAVVDGKEYDSLEPELIADWHAHFFTAFGATKGTAVAALQRARGQLRPADDPASDELAELERRLAAA